MIALAHCLARHCAEAEPEPDQPADVLEEGSFRAARYGTRAELPDADGDLHPVDELLERTLQGVGHHADELGCARELASLQGLLERGGGAGRQRSVYEIAGMDAVVRELIELTGGTSRA